VRFSIKHDRVSLVQCCQSLRTTYLEDFPPEVFLQRPQILRQLLAIGKSRSEVSRRWGDTV
jgi:hypothetical protein